MPHPRYWFVEQQHAGSAGKRHRDFQLAALAMAEVGHESGRTLGETSPRQRRMRRFTQLDFASRIAPETKRMPAVCLNGKGNIVEGGELWKQRCNLKRTRQTELASPINRKVRDFLTVKVDAAADRHDLSG